MVHQNGNKNMVLERMYIECTICSWVWIPVSDSIGYTFTYLCLFISGVRRRRWWAGARNNSWCRISLISVIYKCVELFVWDHIIQCMVVKSEKLLYVGKKKNKFPYSIGKRNDKKVNVMRRRTAGENFSSRLETLQPRPTWSKWDSGMTWSGQVSVFVALFESTPTPIQQETVCLTALAWVTWFMCR